MSNLVVHFEIHASDPQRVIDFYSQLFGWRFAQFGEMEYWSIETGEGSVHMNEPGTGINGGLVKRSGPMPKLGVEVAGANLVVGVSDVDALFAKGIELGGVEAMAPYDLPAVGRLAYLLDPDHNVFGMISPVLSDGTEVMAGS